MPRGGGKIAQGGKFSRAQDTIFLPPWPILVVRPCVSNITNTITYRKGLPLIIGMSILKQNQFDIVFRNHRIVTSVSNIRKFSFRPPLNCRLHFWFSKTQNETINNPSNGPEISSKNSKYTESSKKSNSKLTEFRKKSQQLMEKANCLMKTLYII